MIYFRHSQNRVRRARTRLQSLQKCETINLSSFIQSDCRPLLALISKLGFRNTGLLSNALYQSDLQQSVHPMIWNRHYQNATRFMKLPMRPRRTHKRKTVRFQRFYNLSISFRLHTKTGSIISFLERRGLRPFIARSHAEENHPLTAS